MKVVEEVNNYLFELKESINYYFYSEKHEDLEIAIELYLVEEFKDADQAGGESIFGEMECIGIINLPLRKEIKSKEKIPIAAVGTFNQFASDEAKEHRGAFCYASLSKSEVYRCLGILYYIQNG